MGSVSPYIGLFGTVWGIMHAFIGLGNAGSATALSTVAPGIAEALIATAIGLLPPFRQWWRITALPDTDRFATRFDTFGEGFPTSCNARQHVAIAEVRRFFSQ